MQDIESLFHSMLNVFLKYLCRKYIISVNALIALLVLIMLQLVINSSYKVGLKNGKILLKKNIHFLIFVESNIQTTTTNR